MRQVLVATILLSVVLAAACSAQVGRERTDPPHPDGVARDALWVGGSDGGVFVSLVRRVSSPEGIYHGRIHDESGDLWYAGRLTLEPPGPPVVALDDEDVFSAWDGEHLLLTDGRALRAIDPFPEE